MVNRVDKVPIHPSLEKAQKKHLDQHFERVLNNDFDLYHLQPGKKKKKVMANTAKKDKMDELNVLSSDFGSEGKLGYSDELKKIT